MKDSQGNLVLGRTRWRRFAAVVVPATIAVTALMGGIASGAVPVQMKVSGKTAMLSADKLDATNFQQYGGVVVKKDGSLIPIAASQIELAKITNLCQSVRIKNPFQSGKYITLYIRGGREAGRPVIAKNLVIAMDHLAGTEATFTNIEIGNDASTMTKGGPSLGQAGDFGQQADKAVIIGLRQRMYSTTATTFQLTDMSLNLKFDGSQCFTEIRDGDPTPGDPDHQ